MPVRPLTIPFAALALLLACSPATAQRSAIAYDQSVEDLPSQFPSRADATRNGCAFAHVEGPTVDACVLTVREAISREMHVLVYTLSADSSYGATQHLVVRTGEWNPTLSFLSVSGTDWLVFDHMETGETNLLQFAMLVVAWDGQRFRPVASESLDDLCARPLSVANYELKVGHAFSSNDGLSLRFDYELRKDDKTIGAWSDTLRWDAARFEFALGETTAPLPDSTVEAVRAAITHVRESVAVDPGKELLFFPDVLSSACGFEGWKR